MIKVIDLCKNDMVDVKTISKQFSIGILVTGKIVKIETSINRFGESAYKYPRYGIKLNQETVKKIAITYRDNIAYFRLSELEFLDEEN